MVIPLIRPALVDDADAIARLITELGYATSAEAMCDRVSTILTASRHATFVAEAGGMVVGVADASVDRYYEKDGLYSRLLVLAVSSTARGDGIGGRLINAIEHWAEGHGAREIVVNSGVHRAAAHRFYERHGYARTGFRFVKRLNDAAPDAPGE